MDLKELLKLILSLLPKISKSTYALVSSTSKTKYWFNAMSKTELNFLLCSVRSKGHVVTN